MSSRKEKYLETARKSIVKGQLDRAIKDYEQVVALDPMDMKHRQKLAELLVRVNRQAAAIKEYEAIGKYYAENSYYLKAIAVYKQIQKLNPTDISVSLKLAEFNKKQGLTGNALAEYGIVYTYYQKVGDIKEGFRILDRMLEVDPDNLNTLLKYAEARYSAGLWDEAYHDFSRLALQLLKRGDKPSFSSICDRIQSIFPDKSDFILEMLEAQIENGEAAQAIPRIQEIIKRDNYNLLAWRLLGNAHRKLCDDKGLKSVFRYMIHFFPNEFYPREELIRCAINEGDVSKAVDLLNAHLKGFLSNRDFMVPEHLCLALADMAPDDPRVLSTLKVIYESTGDRDKVQAIASKMAPQPAVPAKPTRELEERHQPAQEVRPAPEVVPDIEEASWEDLDLSIVDQVAGQQAQVGFSTEEQAAEAAAGQEEHLADDYGIDADVLELTSAFEVEREPLSSAGGADDIEDVVEIHLAEEETNVSAEAPDSGVGDLSLELTGDFEEEGLGWLADVTADPFDASDEPLFTEEDLPSFSEFSSAIDVLFPDQEKPVREPVRKSKYNPDALLSAFKRGLDEQVDKSDSETHYNLGIAYKEMGLFDDAIHELQVAGGDSRRAVDCLTLQGICYREKGDFDSGRDALHSALAMKNATLEELTSATYELALLQEADGRAVEAERLYMDVQELKPGFRDVTAKLRSLKDNVGASADSGE